MRMAQGNRILTLVKKEFIQIRRDRRMLPILLILPVLQLIILAMVLLSVTNTVNMTIFERTGEFGTMRALGNRGVDVFALILTEGALLGVWRLLEPVMRGEWRKEMAGELQKLKRALETRG